LSQLLWRGKFRAQARASLRQTLLEVKRSLADACPEPFEGSRERIALRAEARQSKNFAVADAIRDGLKPTGITLEDRAGGTEWEGGGDDALEGVMRMLIDLRATSRQSKDFATADAVRDRLAEAGVTLEDRPGGAEWTAAG